MPVNATTTALAIAFLGGSQTVSGAFGPLSVATTAALQAPLLKQVLERQTNEDSASPVVHHSGGVQEVIHLIEGWNAGDHEVDEASWEDLKAALNANRTSGRKLFPE